MSRCVRDGVVYCRHRNHADSAGKMVCAACGHMKGTASLPLVIDVKPEVTSDSAQTPSSSTEIDVFENEGGSSAKV